MEDEVDLSEYLRTETDRTTVGPSGPFGVANVDFITALSPAIPAISVKSERTFLIIPKIVQKALPFGDLAKTLIAGLNTSIPSPVERVSFDDAVLLLWCWRNAKSALIARKKVETASRAIVDEFGCQAFADPDQIARSIFALERVKAIKLWNDHLHLCEEVYVRGHGRSAS